MNALFGKHSGSVVKIRCPCARCTRDTERLCKLVSVLRHEVCCRHNLEIKNDVSKSIVLQVITLHTSENDGAHTSLLRNRIGRLDVQLDLASFAIDLVADNIVIVE